MRAWALQNARRHEDGDDDAHDRFAGDAARREGEGGRLVEIATQPLGCEDEQRAREGGQDRENGSMNPTPITAADGRKRPIRARPSTVRAIPAPSPSRTAVPAHGGRVARPCIACAVAFQDSAEMAGIFSLPRP